MVIGFGRVADMMMIMKVSCQRVIAAAARATRSPVAAA
jgi:hypothetical protein